MSINHSGPHSSRRVCITDYDIWPFGSVWYLLVPLKCFKWAYGSMSACSCLFIYLHASSCRLFFQVNYADYAVIQMWHEVRLSAEAASPCAGAADGFSLKGSLKMAQSRPRENTKTRQALQALQAPGKIYQAILEKHTSREAKTSTNSLDALFLERMKILFSFKVGYLSSLLAQSVPKNFGPTTPKNCFSFHLINWKKRWPMNHLRSFICQESQEKLKKTYDSLKLGLATLLGNHSWELQSLATVPGKRTPRELASDKPNMPTFRWEPSWNLLALASVLYEMPFAEKFTSQNYQAFCTPRQHCKKIWKPHVLLKVRRPRLSPSRSSCPRFNENIDISLSSLNVSSPICRPRGKRVKDCT